MLASCGICLASKYNMNSRGEGERGRGGEGERGRGGEGERGRGGEGETS